MFNPKGNSLLDEQLTTSGLEMNWVGAAIGAVTSVVGGIMGSNQARSNNSAAKKNAKKQRKYNKKVAKKTNKYNKKVDANQEANYFAMRDFNQKVALENWERGKEIQDYEFDSAMKQFEKSQAIGSAQLGLNSQDAALAIESERRSLTDAFLQRQFAETDSKVALQDELQRRGLEQQSVNLKKSQAIIESRLNKKDLVNRIASTYDEAGLSINEQVSNLNQTYAEAGLSAEEQTGSLSDTYTQQNISRQEQFAQLQSIKSRKQTGAASIENTIEQLTAQGNVQKESAMIEGLLAEGQASLGQAGKSTAKARQSSKAALQRSLMALSSEMSGKRKQAGIQLAELNAEMSLAETGVGLNLQRISGAVSSAERTTGLNLRKISTGLRGAEAATDINMGRIRADVTATERNVENERKRFNAAKRFALEGADIEEQSISNAINIANRDYLQNMDMIKRNYESAKSQSELNIKNIGIQKQYADLNTKAGMMLKPERLSYNPKPQEPPEHIFLKSQKAIPGFVPAPAMQNVYAPLVEGIGGAASQLVGVDFTGGNRGGGGGSMNTGLPQNGN